MVQKFEYRQPRFPIDPAVEVVFRTANGSLPGTCEDMSVDGAGVRFEEPVAIGTKGVLSFAGEISELELKARVAHLDQDRCGLVFDNTSDEQREEIKKIIEGLVNPQAH